MKKNEYKSSDYDRHKEYVRHAAQEKSESERDVAASCPACLDVAIRDRMKTDLRFFLETCFPERFLLAWSPDHLELIADIERAVLTGEQAARAMPRGTGKTSILTGAVIWSVVNGKHEFTLLIASTAAASYELLEGISTEFETNDSLYAYFPELIHPIRMLEGIRQRRLLWNGEPVRQNWKRDRIVLPSVHGADGAGSIIKTAGLLGRIRGMQFTRADGRIVRPSLVLVDDPQTDESAVAEKQNEKRENILCGTVPGLAGPGKKTSILAAMTVKAKGDLSDRMLSREKHPEWHGKKTSLLRSLPTNVDLWTEYAEKYRGCLRRDEPIDEATRFYVANREAMDAGAEASWPQRFNADEASAIQYAMNLKILNPGAFASEYQNSPLVLQEASKQTDGDRVVTRTNGRARGVIPLEVETVTAGIDVQKNYLVYSVAGFDPNATPFILDYGTFPDQKATYFDRRSARHTIDSVFTEGNDDGKLWEALSGMAAMLLGRDYKREDGVQIGLKKVCIDIRYKGELIRKWIKASTHKDVFLAAQGVHVKPGAQGINDREAKIGEVSKHHFRLPPLSRGQLVRTVSFDSAEYISKVHDSLNTPIGQRGAMTLFDAESHLHRCFVDQLCSEYSTWVEANGKRKRVWSIKPNGGDNDFLDSTKLAFVAAYVTGVEPKFGTPLIGKPDQPVKPAQKRPPVYASI